MLVSALVTLRLRRWWERVSGRRRQAAGVGMERVAARLLTAAGYHIEATQPPATAHVIVDGERRDIGVRADFLVRGPGRAHDRWAVEVKSSGRARSPTADTTRRQLLEYALAYELDGVLLVDTTRGRILRIGFDY